MLNVFFFKSSVMLTMNSFKKIMRLKIQSHQLSYCSNWTILIYLLTKIWKKAYINFKLLGWFYFNQRIKRLLPSHESKRLPFTDIFMLEVMDKCEEILGGPQHFYVTNVIPSFERSGNQCILIICISPWIIINGWLLV